MENIFLEYFNLSISASWLVLAVLIARLLLKKAPKWVYCVLWSLVGIRLVFPFSIESVFSLLPSEETISPDSLYHAKPTIDSGIGIINDTVNPVFSEVFSADPVSSVNPLQVVTIIFSYLWVVGIGAMILYTLISYLRLKNKVAAATLLEKNIFQSENVSSPFVLGIIKPKIYLPYNINEADISYVIAHEEAHIKRKDHLIKPLAFLILTVYWFNPVLWLSYVLLCRDIELACDEKVVREFDKDTCKKYSYALLNCSINRRSIAACPLAFGEVGVKDRIKNVLSYKKPAFWVIVIAVISCIVTAICFLTVPKGQTLAQAYQIEPVISENIIEVEVVTPEKTYSFSSKKQMNYIIENLNDIKIDKNKTEEITESPTAYYKVTVYSGDGTYSIMGFSKDLSKMWKGTAAQQIYTTHKPADVESLFTSQLKSAYLKEQADKLVSELIVDFYCPDYSGMDIYRSESHYVFKESFSSSSSTEKVQEIKMFVIYNCSSFSYSKYTLTNEWSAKGVAEFTFKVYDDDRAVYDDFTEHIQGESAEIAEFGNTEAIDKQLEEEVRNKAEAYYGLTVDEPVAETNEDDTTVAAFNEVEFSYNIVPVKNVSASDENYVENLIKSRALNSSDLIRNYNKQMYDGNYCLMYKESSAENLISDYALHMDMNETAQGLASLSEVTDKYSAVQNEKDLYIVYIPDAEGDSRYAVTDFSYWRNAMTAIAISIPYTGYKDKGYTGYLAFIYAPKNVSEAFRTFTAILTDRPEILQNGDEVNLSDIESMNIGAEMPKMLYCENGRLIMSGTFGLIVYDIKNRKVTDRLSYSVLSKVGIEILGAEVSADGERVYLRNYNETDYLYTYYIPHKRLYDYANELSNDTLYKGLSVWNYDGEADVPQQGYIYSSERKHGENGGCYLRAKADWSMKSLQAVIYDSKGKTEAINIF